MKLRDNLLISNLNSENVDYKDVDIEEILSIYNGLMDYIFEDCNIQFPNDKYDPRFNFFITPKPMMDYLELFCFRIFKYLIKFKKHNLLYLLDYSFLTYYFKGSSSFKNRRLEQLYDLLKETYNSYKKYDNFDSYFCDNWGNIIDEVVYDFDNHYEEMMKSNYIPDYYKNYLTLYNNILKKYYDECNYVSEAPDDGFDFYNFIDYSFKYLLLNNLIHYDNPQVIRFLENINNNMQYILEFIKLYHIESCDKLYKYIGRLYKDAYSKGRVIK